MQIDVMSGAPPNAAPAVESTSASPEAGKARGSFADLLDAVAEGQDEAAPADEADDKESAGDEWMTVPVVVPFMPVIPQDIVDTECADATGDNAGVDEVAAVGIDAQAVEAV